MKQQSLLLLLVLLGIYLGLAAAQISGAIFTTNADASVVNANIYPSKESVYISGGPLDCTTSAGIRPDGRYVFQVTSPSGHVCLSTDSPYHRVVTVTGGFFTAYNGTHMIGHIASCPATDHYITVQLAPFLTTPNPGGEYKVWLIPYADFDFTSLCTQHPDDKKTDNFKIAFFIPPPATTQPATTQPQTTQPQTTQPQTTKPQTTQPQTTKPQTTQPQTTKPQTPAPTPSSGSNPNFPTETPQQTGGSNVNPSFGTTDQQQGSGSNINPTTGQISGQATTGQPTQQPTQQETTQAPTQPQTEQPTTKPPTTHPATPKPTSQHPWPDSAAAGLRATIALALLVGAAALMI